MIEFLQSIPGPQFLLVFPLLVSACLVIAKFLVREEQHQAYSLPEPGRFSPVEIAALRGGWKLVLKTVIFSLLQRNIIRIVPDRRERGGAFTRTVFFLGKRARDKYLIKKVKGSAAPANHVETVVCKYLRASRRPAELFNNSILRSFVESYCASIRGEFEQLHLLKSSGERRSVWIVTLTILFVMYSVGGTKCALGFINGRPTVFLVLMLAAALPAVFAVMKPADTLTATGRAYVKRLEEHFGWLKEEMQKQEKPEIDPAYAFAVFGVAAVAGTLLYVPFSEAFPSRQSGGCSGGSCSGGSCSGGGCGGGGCGGGGCGGCGGS
jgi:uncharacterized protein (TIGR04222 family)